MATTPVIPAPPSDFSFADLRSMAAGEKPAAAAETAAGETQETSETAAVEEAATENHETATETVETKPNPQQEEQEPELPEGVKKRIAKEVEKTARIQAEIDRTVSERKAKEAELEKLKTTAPGADPVTKPTTAAANERPKRPEPGEPGHENETWAQFREREAKYDQQLTDYVKAEAVREIEQKAAATNAQKTAQDRWDAAVAKHKAAGVDFPALMESARALAPEGLQVAISSLDNWDGVALHLAQNPDKLKDLAVSYQQNPTKAIATLGRIEAALTPQGTKPATQEKPLPEPLKKVGGSASASGQDLQSQIENGSMASVKALVGKIRGGKK